MALTIHERARKIAYDAAYEAASELGWLEAKDAEYEAFMKGYIAALKEHARHLLYPSPAPPLSSGPSDRDAKATPHDAPPSSTTART